MEGWGEGEGKKQYRLQASSASVCTIQMIPGVIKAKKYKKENKLHLVRFSQTQKAKERESTLLVQYRWKGKEGGENT